MFNTFILNKSAHETSNLSFSLEECIYPQLFSGMLYGEGQSEVSYIANLLSEILPSEALYSERSFFHWVFHHTPYITSKLHFPTRHSHTLFLLCAFSPEFKQEEFFQEMLKRHMIPGMELSMSSFRCIRFYFKEKADQLFLLAEATVLIEERNALELFQTHLPRFIQATSSGMASSIAAKHALATSMQLHFRHQVPSHDQKIFRIQKELNRLVERFPYLFDSELFNEWGVFLALSMPLFVDLRPHHHLTRLIASQFLMRKLLKRNILMTPEKRHLSVRFFSTHLQSQFGKKSVLALLITVNLFDKYEHFDDEHVLLAVQKWIPTAVLVQGSRYLYRNPQEERLCTLYVELDKVGGEKFTSREKEQLRKMLPHELKERVQKLMPILFTVRNEEQVMKSIIVLSQELKHIDSIPQIMFSFEKQTETALIFTLILVYVVDAENSIEERLYSLAPSIEVSLERKDIIGYLEDNHPKEASVFRLQVAKTVDMLRRDFSVNVHLARQKAYAAICQAIGEVRDYDGGLIIKQHELFSHLQNQFPQLAKDKSELLENFFYSITPIEKQATLSIKVLENLFSLVLASLQESFSRKGDYFFKTIEEGARLYVFLRVESPSFKKHLRKRTAHSQIPGKLVVSSIFALQETLCLGYIVETSDTQIRQMFLDLLRNAVSDWQQERKEFQVLRLNFTDNPISLDPRLAGHEGSKGILQMLFEGLTRIASHGKAELAAADRIDLSNDLKTYTFHLRSCLWSNGIPVRASDFEYAWKKILSPDFKTPFAHIFYPIKNAQAAKEGEVSLDDVGIYSLTERSLKVELEHPVPYFLELVAQPLFSPIYADADRTNPHWATGEEATFVCNGPFTVKNNRPQESYLLEKNSHYWDAKHVHLNQVVITKTNARTALEMFKNDELDWLGRPMSAWESLFALAKTDKTTDVILQGRSCWCTLNVKKYPLNNVKLRQAFSYAIDRSEIVEILRDGNPTFSPVPPHLSFQNQELHENRDYQKEMAKQLFHEALDELKLKKDEFPVLHFIYPDVEKREKTAQLLRNQWKSILGVNIFIQGYSWHHLFRKITYGDYELAEVMWSSWINDPMYTLSVFRSPEEYLNFPKWEHPEYKRLLDLAIYELDPPQRSYYLKQAEKILIEQTPIISVFYEKDRGLKKNTLKIEEKFGSLDFKNALFVE